LSWKVEKIEFKFCETAEISRRANLKSSITEGSMSFKDVSKNVICAKVFDICATAFPTGDGSGWE